MIALHLAYNENKLYETLDYWFRDMFNFDFLGKGLEIVSPPHFENNLSRKMVLMLYPINGTNFIVWFPLLLEILAKMCNAIVCWPGCDVTNFEINLIFLIKPFLYMTRKSKQKRKYLENEKSFSWNKKHFSSLLKVSQLPKIVSDLKLFLGKESPS